MFGVKGFPEVMSKAKTLAIKFRKSMWLSDANGIHQDDHGGTETAMVP